MITDFRNESSKNLISDHRVKIVPYIAVYFRTLRLSDIKKAIYLSQELPPCRQPMSQVYTATMHQISEV
jgi:hypothetical protein